MRSTFLSFLFGIMATLGCGGAAQSDESTKRVDTDFVKLTFAYGDGYEMVESIASSRCTGTTVTVDDHGNYTFDGCVTSAQGLRLAVTSEATLDAAQMKQVRGALAELEIGQSGTCGADKGVASLSVEHADGTVIGYLDDFYSCQPAPKGSIYVRNIDTVGGLILQLAPPTTPPTLPFDKLELVASGGMPQLDSGGDCTTAYANTYTLEVASSTLSWDYCDTAVARGSRVLTQAQLESIATELASTVKYWGGECVADVPTVIATLTCNGTVSSYRDLSNSCSTAAVDGPYADNLAPLLALLKSFATSDG